PLGTRTFANDYAYSNFSLAVSGTTFPAHLSLGYDVTVTAGPFDASLHAGGVLNDPGLFAHFSGGTIAFGLSDFSGPAFSSTNLPTSLSLGAFQGKTFQVLLQANDPRILAPSVDRVVDIAGTMDGLSVEVTKARATPEPASWLLFVLGLPGAAALARRRRQHI